MPGTPYSPSKRASIAEAAKYSPYREVALRFGCSISTVSRLARQRLETGHNKTKPRSGRPSKATPRTLARIRRLLLSFRFLSPQRILPLLATSNIAISISSLRRIMRGLGLKRCVARTKPFLTPRVKSLRFRYAQKHRDDDENDWRRTIFTDEAAIRLNGTVKTWVTREQGQAYMAECLVPKLHSAKAACMVWGAIWHGGRSQLHRFDCSGSSGKKKGVTAIIYRDQITKGILKRAWRRVNNRWRAYGGARIVEDGARIHTSAQNRLTGLRQNFVYLTHPPSSPDLNPIENCWAYLKRKLAHLPRRPTTVDDMFVKAQEAWAAIPQEVIDRTVDSMPRRLAEVRKGRGFTTKY
ncbi:hypothetical protein P7C73_g2067, partial [Tremellales sp. Uapishka_1]